jgi:DNA-binding transcriptional LysR family regulator
MLERQLGATLTECRATKRPLPTPLGLEVLSQARVAHAALESVTETVTKARDPLSGTLCLGIIPTIAPFLLALPPEQRLAARHVGRRLRRHLPARTGHKVAGGFWVTVLPRRAVEGGC